MTEPAALQKLLTWLSPAFPVGAFAWSAGLETAIAERTVRDSAALQNWLAGALAHGGIRTDAILLAHAWRAVRTDGIAPVAPPSPSLPARGRVPASDRLQIAPQTRSDTSPFAGGDGRGGVPRSTLADLTDLADLCLALTSARERATEQSATGNAFVTATRAWPAEIPASLPDPCPYPVAVGALAAAHDIGLADTLLGFLTAAVHGQISVAVRLVPLGQTDGLRVMAVLEPQIAAMARTAATVTLADIGAIAYATDIAQMRHETLEPRIFRS